MRYLFFLFLLVSCNTDTQKTQWEVVPIVNDFGEVTKESAVIGVFDGVMKTPYTESASLKVKLLIQDSVLAFTLFEYGSQKATFPANTKLNLRFKTGEEVEEVELFYFQGYIFPFQDTDFIERVQIETTTIKALITQGQNEYLFDIEPNGLKELLATI